MAAAGVDRSCLLLGDYGLRLGEGDRTVEEENRLATDLAAADPDHFVAFFGVDPRRPEAPELFCTALDAGVVTTSRAVVAVMAAGGGGAIVNLSSISATRPRGLTPYSTAKGAVLALTRAMAVDHAGQGIRVNAIAPGPIHTPMVAAEGMSEELRDRRRAASPLGIEGTGWDVGYAALFLVSDEARYITGRTLPVDGGVSIRSPER